MEEFFRLTGRPFMAAARTDRYFPAASIEAARSNLVRAIERAEGPALVAGPIGSGKTLLCRVLAEQFRGSLRVALLSGGRIDSRRVFWQSILYELGLPYRGMDDGELRLSLVGHLTTTATAAKPVLLLVDEAHLLSLRLLDELRSITDLTDGNQPAARLVIVGGASLEERFAHPKLDTFTQRLRVRCYLEPLGREETCEYIRGQIRACGGSPETIFSDDALDLVYRTTDGIPRLINQLCDHALVLAYAEGIERISSSLVDEAWADLQQLPTPWSIQAEATPASRGGTIEFGRLDDDFADDAPAPSVPFPRERVDPAATQRRSASESAEFGHETELSASANVEFNFDDEAANLPGADLPSADQSDYRDEQDDFAPAAMSATEVELTLPAEESDPFGEAFDEEETIVDRFALMPHKPTKKPAAAPAAPAASVATPSPSVPTEHRVAVGHAATDAAASYTTPWLSGVYSPGDLAASATTDASSLAATWTANSISTDQAATTVAVPARPSLDAPRPATAAPHVAAQTPSEIAVNAHDKTSLKISDAVRSPHRDAGQFSQLFSRLRRNSG